METRIIHPHFVPVIVATVVAVMGFVGLLLVNHGPCTPWHVSITHTTRYTALIPVRFRFA
jgi:hypothetical protein